MRLKQLLLISFLILSITFSNIIHVPDNYPTIQAGIDASSDGDTVLVADGEYYENLILDKDITLASHFLLDLLQIS